jgi:hypothetical protein
MALFSLSLLYENRVVCDWFRSTTKFHSGSGVTFEKSLTSCTSSDITLDNRPVIIAPSTSNAIAQKTLHEFSAPSADNVSVGPTVNTGVENFEIKTGLITIV